MIRWNLTESIVPIASYLLDGDGASVETASLDEKTIPKGYRLFAAVRCVGQALNTGATLTVVKSATTSGSFAVANNVDPFVAGAGELTEYGIISWDRENGRQFSRIRSVGVDAAADVIYNVVVFGVKGMV